MLNALSKEKLQIVLNADTEFRFASRYWDGAIQLDLGDLVYVLRLKAGEVVSVDSTRIDGTKQGEVGISATVSDWNLLLEKFPRPFYQDFYPASMHHSFVLSGDSDYIWAYYAALRRCGQIMRIIVSSEEK